MMINNVLVVENKNAGATLSEIHVYLERQLDGKWKVVNRTSENLQIKEYEPDPELTALLASYDTRAKEDAVTPIGELKGGDLAPENEIDCLPQAMRYGQHLHLPEHPVQAADDRRAAAPLHGVVCCLLQDMEAG